MAKLYSSKDSSSKENNIVAKGSTNKVNVDILDMKVYDRDNGTQYTLGELFAMVLDLKEQLNNTEKSNKAVTKKIKRSVKDLTYAAELLAYKQASVELDIKDGLNKKGDINNG